MIRHDDLAQIFRVMVMIAGGLSCLISMGVDRLRDRGDYYAILIVSVIGASLVSAAADLIMIFLALETLSITLYLLAGYLRNADKSTEAGLKYFLFGAFASAVSLYGLSLVYGFAGQDQSLRAGPADRQRGLERSARCWSRWCWCWWASALRSAPCRSISGHRMSTKARPPRSHRC